MYPVFTLLESLVYYNSSLFNDGAQFGRIVIWVYCQTGIIRQAYHQTGVSSCGRTVKQAYIQTGVSKTGVTSTIRRNDNTPE